jgi:RNase P/RNase MRP subunit p30
MYDFGIFGDFDVNLEDYGFLGGVFFKNQKKSVVPGFFLKSDNKSEVRRFSNKRGFLLLECEDYKTRRFAAEKGLVDGIINAENYGKKNSLKYPDSGMDDKLMKFMAESNVSYVINLRNIIERNKTREIMFNAMLARKFKTPMMIVSGAEKPWQIKHCSGLISAGVILGLDKNEAKKSLFYAQEKVIKRFKK